MCEQAAGYFALERHYDKMCRNDKLVYLGANLKPIKNNAGYSIVHREFYEDNKVEFELYYDENNRPVTISNGAHIPEIYMAETDQKVSQVGENRIAIIT